MTSVNAGDERFDFGRVVGQTFGLIGRNFVLFLIMALVFVGAPQFGVLYAQMMSFSTDPSLVPAISGLGVLINLVTQFILQGALTRAAVDDLSGAGVKFGAAIGDGLRFFFPLLLVAILVTLGTFAGLVFLVVPGLMLAVRWAVAAPVVVVEKVGPTSSMGRSADLSRNHRWSIFGLFLLYLVFAYAVQIILGVVMSALGANPMSYTLDGVGIGFAVASAAIAALISLVSTVGTASLYFELRRVKEGVGVSELAKVFE